MNTEQEAYRISSIKVEGLFGMFDHEIPLNLDERITIVYGENGIGKTMVFRIVVALFRMDFVALEQLPFDRVEVDFFGGDRLIASKTGSSIVAFVRVDLPSLFFEFSGLGLYNFRIRVLLLGQYQSPFDSNLLDLESRLMRSGFGPEEVDGHRIKLLEAIGSLRKEFSIHDCQQIIDLIEKIPLDNTYHLRSSFENLSKELIPAILKDIHFNFIETNRLLITEKGKSSDGGFVTKYSSAIDQLSADLAKRIQSAKDEYSSETEKLEKSFVRRLSSGKVKTNYGLTELKSLELEIRQAYLELIGLGLLTEEDSPIGLEIADDLSSELFVAVGVGLHDMKEKLSLYQELEIQARLLLAIINERRFSFKKLEINPQKGFVFFDAHGHELSASNLSSGEQHELVLLYNLIFNTPPGSLVMIDEPELSLHVAWQMEFLNDMREIIELKRFDLLVATHSPSIINGEWDLTVELKGQKAHA